MECIGPQQRFELTTFLWAGGAERGFPTRRAGASAVIMFVAPLAGVPAARTLCGGVAAGGETPRQDPQSVNSADFRD